MSNLANIGVPLRYCGKNSGNFKATCSNIATWQVKLCHKNEKGKDFHLKVKYDYRCDEHKHSSTSDYMVFDTSPFDQGYALQKINDFLKSIIGKKIHSKFHTARELEVRYLKSNGGIMCFQPITKKWKYVYYNQIDSIL
jgi:hypothetical protein